MFLHSGRTEGSTCTSSYSFLLSLANGAWSKLVASHSIYTVCTRRAVSNRRKQFVVFLESAFNLRTMSFRKEGGGLNKVIGPSLGRGGRRGKEPPLEWVGFLVREQQQQQNAEFMTFYFGVDLIGVSISKMAHITFTPNTLWSHGRKALIIPGIWAPFL